MSRITNSEAHHIFTRFSITILALSPFGLTSSNLHLNYLIGLKANSELHTSITVTRFNSNFHLPSISKTILLFISNSLISFKWNHPRNTVVTCLEKFLSQHCISFIIQGMTIWIITQFSQFTIAIIINNVCEQEIFFSNWNQVYTSWLKWIYIVSNINEHLLFSITYISEN